MSDASVRQATAFDLDMVAPLFDAYRQFYAQPADLRLARRFLRERFAHHESVVLVAIADGGSAVGFVQLYPLFSSVRATRTYLLNDLFVAAPSRRRGIGEQLVAAATAFARANGAASLSCRRPPTTAPRSRCTSPWAGAAATGSMNTACPCSTPR